VALALIVDADTTIPLTLYNLATWSAYLNIELELLQILLKKKKVKNYS